MAMQHAFQLEQVGEERYLKKLNQLQAEEEAACQKQQQQALEQALKSPMIPAVVNATGPASPEDKPAKKSRFVHMLQKAVGMVKGDVFRNGLESDAAGDSAALDRPIGREERVRRRSNDARARWHRASMTALKADASRACRAGKQDLLINQWHQTVEDALLERRMEAVFVSFALYGEWKPDEMVLPQACLHGMAFPRFRALCTAAGLDGHHSDVRQVYDLQLKKKGDVMLFPQFIMALCSLSERMSTSSKTALSRVAAINVEERLLVHVDS